MSSDDETEVLVMMRQKCLVMMSRSVSDDETKCQ